MKEGAETGDKGSYQNDDKKKIKENKARTENLLSYGKPPHGHRVQRERSSDFVQSISNVNFSAQGREGDRLCGIE